MRKIIITTSMALVSIQAMAAATNVDSQNVQVVDSKNLNQQLKEAFDSQKFNSTSDEHVGAVYNKKAVREALEDAYPVMIKNYGQNGQTLHDQYFQDIKDKIKKVSLPTTTGTQDSTNVLPGQQTGYDTCDTDPTTSGENLSSTPGCVCHGACHGNCHGSRGWR